MQTETEHSFSIHYYSEINIKTQLTVFFCETRSNNYIKACYKVHK